MRKKPIIEEKKIGKTIENIPKEAFTPLTSLKHHDALPPTLADFGNSPRALIGYLKCVFDWQYYNEDTQGPIV